MGRNQNAPELQDAADSTPRIARIRLDTVPPIELLGSRDIYLKQIDAEFEAHISARGNEILVQGEDDEVAEVHAVVEHLVELISAGTPLSRQRVRYAIEMIRDRRAPELSRLVDRSEPLRPTAGTRTVVPKTVTQQAYVEAIRSHDVSLGIGPAGTGKTYLAVACAVEALTRGEVERIILTRPAVEAGESLGYLPGDLRDKVDPYLRPLYDALGDMMQTDRVNRLMENGTIEVVPLAYMRGRTLNRCFIILDEGQNATRLQIKMFLTRLGNRAKAVLTGDVTQVDLDDRSKSGLVHARKILSDIPGIAVVEFGEADVVRHALVRKILGAYDRDGQGENAELSGLTEFDV